MLPCANDNGGGIAAAQRDCGIVQADRNRVTAEGTFMTYLDTGTLDEAHFQQLSFELDPFERGQLVASEGGDRSPPTLGALAKLQ